MKFLLVTLLFALALAPAPRAAAQTPRAPSADEDFALERRAEADPRAIVSLCVASGDIIVRGWDRGEVRARIEEAGTLRLLTPNVRPAPRVEVLVSPERDAELGAGECGSNERVELMVPRGATLDIQSRSGHVEVADVAEARVRALSGDVDVRRVSQAVEVSCLSGDVSVSDSSGPVRVTTVSGDVEARGVRTVSPADNFEGKSTSGDVTLEEVAHGRVTGTTVSGNVLYTGGLARGGAYDFRTISGNVTMELPADSSFKVHAKVVVSGTIDTDFPVRVLPGSAGPPDAPQTPQPPQTPGAPKPGKVKVPREATQVRLDGTVGTGDAVVNLSSFSGSLYLRKR